MSIYFRKKIDEIFLIEETEKSAKRKMCYKFFTHLLVQEVLAQITWYHNLALMDKLHDTDTRIWYAKKVCENGWSRNVLVHQIETKLYERQALANKITNFENRLPSPQSELAVQTIKDPYVFDFIPFKEPMNLTKRRKPHSGNESYVIRDNAEYVDDELNAFNSLWENAQKI